MGKVKIFFRYKILLNSKIDCSILGLALLETLDPAFEQQPSEATGEKY